MINTELSSFTHNEPRAEVISSVKIHIVSESLYSSSIAGDSRFVCHEGFAELSCLLANLSIERLS